MQPTQTGQANPFVNPNAPGASIAPRVADMDGCLVAFSPTAFTAAGTGDNLTGYEGDKPRDRVTTNVLLLETPRGPIIFGGSPETSAQKPHTHTVMGPARFSGVWVTNSNIVAALAPGGVPLVGAMVLGRIVRSEVGRRPWNLVSVDGTPDMTKAVEIYTQLNLGALAYNEPQPLAGTAAPAVNSVSYAPPPQAAPGAYPGDPGFAPGANYAAWQAQQQQAQAQAAQAAAYAATQAAGVNAVQAAFPQAQVVAGYPVPQPGPAPAGPPVPPGWNPQGWDTLTVEQKMQVWASMGGVPTP